MSDTRFRFEPLGRHHNRADFSCGVEALDTYLQRQAGQEVRRNVAAVFVLCDIALERIAGFYTLSASSINPTDLPEDMVRRLPRYPSLPAVLIGRLAVDVRYQGQALGELLLYDAFRRIVRHSEQIAAIAAIVDAKDDRARSYYERYDFQRFATEPYRLFLPMQTIARIVAEADT